ncbi:MAG TPA: AI-2E family transporter [bacterium]|nr:AI-2E family transporter [bacterium]HPT30177.1 AI-2E family transporter [bacterium]
MTPNKFGKPFLLLLVLAVIVACYFIFRPFLTEILVAAVLVSILYRPYSWLTKRLGNRRQIAAGIMCLLAVALIIVPVSELLIYSAKKSIVAYNDTLVYFDSHGSNWNNSIQSGFLDKISFMGFDNSSIKNFVIDMISRSSSFIVDGATLVIKSTTNFLFSLVIIIFTMFFFFVDGERMVRKLMHWSPLPNKYDERLFKKFRDVSYSTIVATFAVVAVQGFVGGVGYAIVGLPAFFAGLLIAVCSLIPMIGSIIIYVPTAIYLLVIGQTWQGLFILLWGALIVGSIDNLIRPYLIKGKAHVNPIFLFFSILGGVALFGFWGVIIGPLIISIAITVFHIYELEFAQELETPPALKEKK